MVARWLYLYFSETDGRFSGTGRICRVHMPGGFENPILILFHMKKTLFFVCSLLLAATSCNRDEVIEEEIAAAPAISLDSETSSYAVKCGRELTIAPEYEHVEGAIYTWSLDGRVVGSEPDYTFCSDEAGRYWLCLEVATRYGTAREELRIDVGELEIPYVSLAGSENGFRILTGAELVFTPVVAETSLATSCKWILNGMQVSDSESYTFKSAEKGEYEFRFEASNEDGSDSLEFTVQVCTADELPFGWHFDSTVLNTSVGRTTRLMPFDIENDFDVTYTWTRNGESLQSGTSPMLRFTPDAAGSYTFTITAESPYFDAVSQTLTVNVHAANATRRTAAASSSIYCVKVHDITPAPGQFVAQISTSTRREDAIAAAEKILSAPANYVSLGSYGGYVVVGFDHSIENRGSYDFAVLGNSFNNSSEPGIVWVMQDENGNGQPDDTWYELKGSEYGKPETILDYAVTYYRPRSTTAPVTWRDNMGGSGSLTLNPHYPDWVSGDSYTLRGSHLAARNTDTSGGGTYWENRNYEWGYADNYSLIDRITNDSYNYFRISDAVDFEGNAVDLPYIDFVKVQCAVNATSGWLGEISTEVLTIKDYNLEKSRN